MAPEGDGEHERGQHRAGDRGQAARRPELRRRRVPAAVDLAILGRADDRGERGVETNLQIRARRRRRDRPLDFGQSRLELDQLVFHVGAARQRPHHRRRVDQGVELTGQQAEDRLANVADDDRFDTGQALRQLDSEVALDHRDAAAHVARRLHAGGALANEDADVEGVYRSGEAELPPGQDAEARHHFDLAVAQRPLQLAERGVSAELQAQPGPLGDGLDELDGEAARPAVLDDVVGRPVGEQAHGDGRWLGAVGAARGDGAAQGERRAGEHRRDRARRPARRAERGERPGAHRGRGVGLDSLHDRLRPGLARARARTIPARRRAGS